MCTDLRVDDRSAARHAELGELCGDGLAVSGRSHIFIDVRDSSIAANVERPPGRERLIRIDNAVRCRDGLGWIAEERIVHSERLREFLIRLWLVHADGKVRDIEGAELIPTLTE